MVCDGKEFLCHARPLIAGARDVSQFGSRGFTLIELIIVVAIVGILATIAMPLYGQAREKARVYRAVAEIRNLETEILAHFTEKGVLPVSLNDIGRGSLLDPWDHPYEYRQVATAGALLRKRFGMALNTEFDLYSKGNDGASAALISDPSSADDVVLANDGGFIGLAETY